MITDVLKGKSGKSDETQAPANKDLLSIGEAEANFVCPVCARPLAEGTSKCPGCGARLIMGVQVKRAGTILALGMVIGVLIGGLLTASVITVGLRPPAVAAAAIPTDAPAAVVPIAAPTPAVFVPDLAPVAAVSALTGTAVVNARIAVDAAALSATLARSDATSIEIARALRLLASDAALGIDIVARLVPWVDAQPVTAQLDDFYRKMGDAARAGLRSSLTDTGSYRRAGAQMTQVLAALADVDAASRTLAATVDLELPPLTLPKAASAAAVAETTNLVPATQP